MHKCRDIAAIRNSIKFQASALIALIQICCGMFGDHRGVPNHVWKGAALQVGGERMRMPDPTQAPGGQGEAMTTEQAAEQANRQAMPVVATAPMKAVAVVITRLRSDATFDEALVFVHEMCNALDVSTSMFVAALGLGHSLIVRWPDWRLGLAMGLSLAFKLTRSVAAPTRPWRVPLTTSAVTSARS